MNLCFAPTCTLGIALCACAVPVCAFADDVATPPAPAITVNASLLAATDYVWRGFSQTNQNPAVFAEIDLASHGFYLSGRTENVKFAGIKQEYDGWGGYVQPIGPIKLDVGFVRYGYINGAINTDTLEGKVALSGDIGKLNAHVAGFVTGNYFGTHNAAEYYEVGGSYPLMPKLTLTGALGHQTVNHDFHYDTWNVGLGYALRKGMNVGVRYVDTNTRVFGDLGGARVVGSFGITF